MTKFTNPNTPEFNPRVFLQRKMPVAYQFWVSGKLALCQYTNQWGKVVIDTVEIDSPIRCSPGLIKEWVNTI